MITCKFEDGNNALLRHTVVDALVMRGGKLLMVKRSLKLIEGGKWGLIGGYMERDESLIQAASREILEETGWQVRNLTLIAVIDRPDRPHEDRQNIAFLYMCEATEKTGEPDWESDAQQWYSLDELPPKAQIAFDHFDHIELYKRYLKEPFPLPLIGSYTKKAGN